MRNVKKVKKVRNVRIVRDVGLGILNDKFWILDSGLRMRLLRRN